MICDIHHREMRQIGASMVCPSCLAEKSKPALSLLNSLHEHQEAIQAERRLADARIPFEFKDASFDSFTSPTERATKVCAVLRHYAENFDAQRATRYGFIFTGPPGTAKTHLACAIVRTLAHSGYSPVYASLPRLTQEMRSAYGRSGAFAALLERLSTADLLVLDEIDLHGSSDNDYNTLYDIINARYEASRRPTIVISNRGLDRLSVDLDERLISRILAGTKPVVFDWPGMRDCRRKKVTMNAGAQS